MIISRSKYEQEKNEAYMKGVRDTEDRFYQREEIQRLHERLNRIAEDVRHLKGPNEAGSCDNATCAAAPMSF